MTDLLSTDLQLNLFTGPRNIREDRPKISSRSRRERIKLRRQDKKEKQLLKDQETASKSTAIPDDVESHNDETVQQRKYIPKRRHDVKDDGHNVKKQRLPGSVISSLFRNNPDIPAIESVHVTSVKERIFSANTFKELQLHTFMVSNLEEKLGLSFMTAVQQQSIPVLLSGEDALIKSQTGSGKTLAYAIPIVQLLQALSPKVQRSDGPYAVIIVPTRELAIQSFDAFQKLVQPFLRIVPGCIVGGEKRKAEKARLRKGINILIATPGRLLDHLENTGCLKLENVKWFIIDEADRLLDMGFEQEVSKIINALKSKCQNDIQTVLLSATLTDGVERVAGISMKNPTRINITLTEPVSDPTSESTPQQESPALNKKTFALPENLKQHYIITPSKLRLVTLSAFILQKYQFAKKKSKIMVFMSTQDSVEFHYNVLDYLLKLKKEATVKELLGIKTKPKQDDETPIVCLYKLHGNITQKQRTKVYQDFCETSSGILLCTDVASRGLHLPHVDWIVQYTTPADTPDYIHRVGRTARAGAMGHSLLFLMPEEVKYIETLNSYNIDLGVLKMEEILQTLLKVVHKLPRPHDLAREHPRTYDEAATYLQLCLENWIEKNKDISEVAKKAYLSFIRAYATYPTSLKDIFHVKHLHLGHMAKSFGLRQPPKSIGLQQAKETKLSKRAKLSNKNKRLSAKRRADAKLQRLSEFSSGQAFKKRKRKEND